MFSKKLHASKKMIAVTTALSVLTAVPVLAAPASTGSSSVPPTSGQILNDLNKRQITPGQKEAPQLENKVKEEKKKHSAQGRKFHVNSIHITGQDLYSESVLLSLVKDALNKDLTLGEINDQADNISDYFHKNGYAVAKAYIPPQSIKNGNVEIRVSVGQYGIIDIQNKSRLHTPQVKAFLSGIKAGQYVNMNQLQKAVLLLDDLSGVHVKATLAPGKEQGTTDLRVELKEEPRDLITTLWADNYGNEYAGKTSFSANFVLNNANNIGDEYSLTGGVSDSDNFAWGSTSYKVPIGTSGGRLGIEYSHVHYYLGEKFASLGALGTATTTTAYFTQPLVRSESYNLSARFGFAQKSLEDYLGNTTTWGTNKKKSIVKQVGFFGDKYDADGRGTTSFSYTLSLGNLSIKNANFLSDDSDYARTNGSYVKNNVDLSRQRHIKDRLSYSLAAHTQWSNKNLDSSEKMYLGGPNGVRAYGNGDVNGDSGLLVSGELHFDMPTPNLQLIAFLDTGRVSVNHETYNVSQNKYVLTGTGLGVLWNVPKDLSVRLDYATRLTGAVYGDSAKSRVWLQAIKHL